MTRCQHAARRGLAGLLACLPLAACHNPRALDEATQQTLALAEATWPGQFQLYKAGRRGDLQGYEIILAARDDANFRVKLSHRDLSICEPQRCRQILQHAYDSGHYKAAIFNTSVAALRGCGLPMLGMVSGGSGPAPLVELDIQGDTRAALARLSPCAQAYWAAWAQAAAGTGWGPPHWELYLRQSGANPSATPEHLDWETRAPSRPDAPLYAIWLRPDTPLPPEPARLRVIAYTDYYKQLQAAILAHTERYLDVHLRGATLNQVAPMVWRMAPDPADIRRLHAQVLLCSPQAVAQRRGNCREDMALALQYDSHSGQASDERLLRNIRNADGSLTLPPLRPGVDD
ncbi:hypothetical protein EBQ34_01520 [Vandammella animalimorsus]|uniref:Uncharacterized protein n=1 Tax=Vandammella animalimorsus TaxID=2029117 RepID=A0A3M6RUS8_9BURK|nr:hypothetical protein [Vandammella animalimorsus]RMX18441.1 hypothetical protein EBQ34_01520 [Vandammella animalimorsus]